MNACVITRDYKVLNGWNGVVAIPLGTAKERTMLYVDEGEEGNEDVYGTEKFEEALLDSLMQEMTEKSIFNYRVHIEIYPLDEEGGKL